MLEACCVARIFTAAFIVSGMSNTDLHPAKMPARNLLRDDSKINSKIHYNASGSCPTNIQSLLVLERSLYETNSFQIQYMSRASAKMRFALHQQRQSIKFF